MQQYLDFATHNWELFVALAVILVLLARSYVTDSNLKSLRPFDAVRKINQDDAIVLDVRTDDEFGRGHILDSMHIPLGLLQSRLQELSDYKSQPIIICCRSGNRSAQAASVLHKQGFNNLYNLSGGITAWETASLPTTTKASKPGKKRRAESKALTQDKVAEEPEPARNSEPLVQIYTARLCLYCWRAIRLLKSKGVSYREFKIDGHAALREQMKTRSGASSVPQIFIGDRHVGGSDDLAALDSIGELDGLLNLPKRLQSNVGHKEAAAQ